MAIPANVVTKSITIAALANYSFVSINVGVSNQAVRWTTGVTISSMIPAMTITDPSVDIILTLPISGQVGFTPVARGGDATFYYSITVIYTNTLGIGPQVEKTYYLVASSPNNQDFATGTSLSGGGGTTGGGGAPPIVIPPSGTYEPLGLSDTTKATLASTYAPLGAISGGSGVIAGGTTGQVLAKSSNSDYSVSWQSITPASLSLGNVNNTSDANKPVSTAQAAADAAVASTAAAATAAKYTKPGTGIPMSDLSSAVQTAITAGGGGGSSGVSSVNTRTGVVTLTATDVGLGNVTNVTPDNLPLSLATISALAGKAATTHTHTLSQITDATAFGQSLVKAVDAPTARTTLGAAALSDIPSSVQGVYIIQQGSDGSYASTSAPSGQWVFYIGTTPPTAGTAHTPSLYFQQGS